MRRAFTMVRIVPTLGLALLLTAGGSGCSSDANQMPSGSGGSGGGGGTGAGTVNCGDNQAIDPTAVIDDMETPDYMTLRAGGRNGAWWAGGDDKSPSATIQPNGDAAAETISGGRCGSKSAMHVTGQGWSEWAVLSVSMGWGSVDGGADGLLPNDNSFRTGVTFWARIGDTSSNQVRLAISDKYSRPEGGICVLNGAVDVACYDTHGVDLSQLDTTWRQYRIPFGGLTQRGFGLKRDHLDPSTIYTVEFQLTPTSVFDFWLDDIAFY
jgi:hypothetical protein